MTLTFKHGRTYTVLLVGGHKIRGDYVEGLQDENGDFDGIVLFDGELAWDIKWSAVVAWADE